MSNPATASAGTTGQSVGGGETDIYSTATLGMYVLNIDLTLMATGDVVEIRGYEMMKTGGTATVKYIMVYYGAQPTDDEIKSMAPLFTTLTGDTKPVKWTISQTFGTQRAFPYNVQQWT